MTILSKYKEILSEPSQIIDEVLVSDELKENAIVYLAGSLAEGFGNVNSDIDIYCLLPSDDWEKLLDNKRNDSRGLKIFGENNLIHNIYLDEYRVDIEFWNIEYVNKIISKLNSFDVNAEQYTTRFNKDDLDFLHRMKYGKCIYNNNLFIQLYEEVNFMNLGFYQVIVGSEYFGSYLEDIEGAIDAEDFGTTFVIGKMLLEISISNFLFSVQETNPSPKWLYRKIQRYEEKVNDFDISEKFWAYQNFNRYEDNILTHTMALIDFCTLTNNKAQENLVKYQRGINHVSK
ncbi:hypothetical protein HCJ39_06840 [Listeria rocourtiae]|uniref:nucleotidyltransferase domain-containing protein n=1 Tax=Listeria rocourtiae TaxID=647910 RepID=UPI001624AFCC|nr:nucleotidyltransferase domain-containing protein [Listeria rocourtiae]MBC1604426.1 hypothetical protein [Listeria rocourtiae]